MSSRRLKLRPRPKTDLKELYAPVEKDWRFSVSVMGATPKQRSIYINTWIDFKNSEKKKRAVRQAYGNFYQVRDQSHSVQLVLHIHDIETITQIKEIWDTIHLNVIVLPFNYTNVSVNSHLKALIEDLKHTKIPLRRLFSKTLLICPSTFSSMRRDAFIQQTSTGMYPCTLIQLNI